MEESPGRFQFTLTQLLVIFALLLELLVPAIQQSREEARRAGCLARMHNLGVAFHNLQSRGRGFPSSCTVKRNEAGEIVALDGWSWCIRLLPYLEWGPLYDTLDIHNSTPLTEPPGGGKPHAAALSVALSDYLCPSFRGTTHVDMKTKAEAITNYKAMGATHLESLNVASTKPTVPRYGDLTDHPDGGIHPGSALGPMSFPEGTAYTILVVESIEQNVARWTVGNETCLVGLPPVVTFTERSEQIRYAHPTGYSQFKFWDQTTIPDGNNRTYLKWDYDRYPYDDGGVSTPSAAASGPIKYGPSSDHPGVTNHLFADGSVETLSNDIDAAAYMFQITRGNGDLGCRLLPP